MYLSKQSDIFKDHLKEIQQAHEYESHCEKGKAGVKNKNDRLLKKTLVRTKWLKIVYTNMK